MSGLISLGSQIFPGICRNISILDPGLWRKEKMLYEKNGTFKMGPVQKNTLENSYNTSWLIGLFGSVVFLIYCETEQYFFKFSIVFL